MIESKQHLKKIKRLNLDKDDRSIYLRLDKNEFVGSFPGNVFSNALSKITIFPNNKIIMYPEYGNLKKKIAKHTGTKPENVILGNGSDTIIKNIFEVYLDVTTRALITDPTFAMYPIYCKMFNVWETIEVKYKSLTEFPKEEFMKHIKSPVKKKIAVIINPNNPTGHAVDEEYLLEVIKEAQKRNILVVIDEAYHYYYKKSMAKYVNKFDNLIVIRTFSKFFGLAGLRIGFALAHPSIIENLRKVQSTYPVDCVAVTFAEEILNHSEIEKQIYDKFIEGKKYIIGKLKSNNITYHVEKGNFILVKCDQKIVDKLKDARILVKGNFKQDILKDYIRVTIGDKEAMKTFWYHFERYYND